MFIKEYGCRSLRYIKRYPKHYAGYFLFGTTFCIFAIKCKESKNDFLRIGCAGAMAQFGTEIILHPIDVINTRTKAEVAHQGTNSLNMMRRIYDKEGFFGFWRGASCTFYGLLMGGFIYFSFYKYLKHHLKKYEGEGHIHTLSYLTSSLIGELLFLFFYYPFDLIRTRMQTRMPQYNYKGPIDAVKQITEGKPKNLKKLFTGAPPSFILNMATQAILFTVLESMREYYLKKYNLTSVTQLSTSTYLICSATAGFVSAALTNILEVITVHKQVDTNFKLKKFIREHGIRSFTQGLTPRVASNIFYATCLFYVVDYISQIYEVEL